MLLSESWQEANSMTPGYVEFMNLKVILSSAILIVKCFHETVGAVGVWFTTNLQCDSSKMEL